MSERRGRTRDVECRWREPGDAVAGALVRAARCCAGALDWVRHALRGVPSLAPRGTARPARRGRPEARSSVRRARWAVRLPDCDPVRDLDRLRPAGRRAPGARRTPAGRRAGRSRRRAPFCLWVRGTADLARAWCGRSRWSARGPPPPTANASRSTWRTGWPAAGSGWSPGRVRHRRGRAPRCRRAGRPHARRARRRGRPGLPGRQRPPARGASSVPGARWRPRCRPAACPTKSRFLQRNRLIAAAGRATVVVEAAWRSGAISTAHHAARLLRPVGAVPGPVTSMASAGCHRLLRDGVAVCVTDAAEVRELAGLIGTELASGSDAAADARAARPHDALDPVTRRVLDALRRAGRRPARPRGERRGGDRGGGAGRRRSAGARGLGGATGRRMDHRGPVDIMTAASCPDGAPKALPCG